jgi:hypothetical protein
MSRWGTSIRTRASANSLSPGHAIEKSALIAVRKPYSNHSLTHACMHLISVVSSLVQVVQPLISLRQTSKNWIWCLFPLDASYQTPIMMLAQRSLYPRMRFSRLLSATAQDQARPASPPNRLSGQEDFSSMPSLSMDFISWPVV